MRDAAGRKIYGTIRWREGMRERLQEHHRAVRALTGMDVKIPDLTSLLLELGMEAHLARLRAAHPAIQQATAVLSAVAGSAPAPTAAAATAEGTSGTSDAR